MSTFTVREAAAHLDELVDAAKDGTVVIVKGDRAVRLVPAVVPADALVPQRKARHFGSATGKIQMTNDFDAPLEEFADYM